MKRTRGQQRGIVAVVVAMAILILLAMAGLAIDIGHLVLNKSRLQSTVDAAALAAAKVLDQGYSEGDATAAAMAIIQTNADKYNELLSALGDMEVNVEYSHTLNPFVTGSTPADYVRVRAENFSMWTSFTRLVGFDEMSIRASAVAGPSAPIGSPCDLFPVAVCADMTAGPPHWGYAPYGEAGSTVTLLKLASQAAGATFGPGNFQLIRLGGTGASVVRTNMAGGAACVEGGLLEVDPKPGNVVGPVADGINTRFGQYSGSLGRGAADYPPDRVVRSPASPLESADGTTITNSRGEVITDISQVDYTYADYLADYAAGRFQYSAEEGRPQRRVVTIPIVDCTIPVPGSSGTLPLKGFGCFFLLQPVRAGGGEGWIFGQFLEECVASGSPGQQGGTGPYTIVLHNDPDSPDS